MRHALLLALLITGIAAAEPLSPRLQNSWIHIDDAICRTTLVEGQRCEVAVEYSLAEGPAATLVLSGHGPWIDLPDGTVETKRHHVDYPGLSAQAEVQPGRGRQVFSFTVPKLHGHDSLLWIASFKDGKKTWPWEVRQGCGPLRQADPVLRVGSAIPGNLFTYAEPVRFTIACGSRLAPGRAVEVSWSVTAVDGTTVANGKLPFTVPAAEASVALDIPLERRGVFVLHLAVDGAGSVDTTFARIPDVIQLTHGEATRFGLHAILGSAADAEMDQAMDEARRLGLTFCRQFVSWNNLEPARGEWRLDDLDRALTKAQQHGIGAMICLTNPPPWAMRNRYKVGFEPFAFDEPAWSEAITTMTRRFKGRLAAWEWLNEIVPGSESDPIGVYLQMVRLGRAAAKAEDPQVLSVLAGGLWPRSFRLGLLAAGIGSEIDVLPVHYSSGAGVAEASADLAAASAGTVAVWDDETAKGVSTWRIPPADALGFTGQRDWVMQQWPAEIEAGAQRIIYFGGSGDPAGNWDWRFEDGTPRAVAATLAVMAVKLHRAEPQGGFAIAGSGRYHLFAVDGKAVLVAPAGKAAQRLRIGSTAVAVTDDQGEERRIAGKDGDVELPPSALPTFVEGGDLDVLRGYTAPELLTSQIGLLAGAGERLRVRITNRSTKPLRGSLETALPAGWTAVAAVPFVLAGGESKLVDLTITAPPDATEGDHRLIATCRYDDARLPVVELPWQLAVIDPKHLGNLLVDGDFESADHGAWHAGKGVTIAAADGFPAGLGHQVLRMPAAGGWQNAGQTADLVAGRSYLYSAWIHVEDKQAGSNLDQVFADGHSRSLYMPSVFSAANNPDWQFLSMVYRAPDGITKVGLTPVANGSGTALFDNIRLTAYDGSNFTAEATRAAHPPTVDGELADWEGGCPIPLLGPGQTAIYDKTWLPGSSNLRGVVKLRWDDTALYLAAWVDDDILAAPETGDRCPESDSLVLALHPGNRAPGEDARAFCYYLSPASPGGGSGKSTLYRPSAHSGGLASGQLAKDSSIYELAIRRDGTRTCYEARLPWSELGVRGRLGVRLGCSLQLNDNDGHGRAASIQWGDGIAPAWSPGSFGILTLTE